MCPFYIYVSILISYVSIHCTHPLYNQFLHLFSIYYLCLCYSLLKFSHIIQGNLSQSSFLLNMKSLISTSLSQTLFVTVCAQFFIVRRSATYGTGIHVKYEYHNPPHKPASKLVDEECEYSDNPINHTSISLVTSLTST